jgi:DNA repair protein RAD50
MASIDKLSIRGIRSFSPNDEMTIEFYSPLTMIVGANGCGKTSIIESLKYACTGALPPTCRNGQSFINDPTMTDQSEVKACVKLRFRNKAGKTSVVVRSMQLTKKKTKLEFKALDGCIRSAGENNQSISTSHKCTELDKHVPDMLGVSPAILENVIFCHQEDSNWPMGEGIILKKKFDDVFESTRYTKALEAIQKSKKEYTSKAKDLKAEVRRLCV